LLRKRSADPPLFAPRPWRDDPALKLQKFILANGKRAKAAAFRSDDASGVMMH